MAFWFQRPHPPRTYAAEERDQADPEGHQAADRAHHGQERARRRPTKGGDRTEQDRQRGRDGGQADPLDEAGAGAARRARCASVTASREVEGHEVAGDRRRRPRRRGRPARPGPRWRPSGASAGANPMNHECGSPLPPSSAVPDFPAVVTPGTLAPGRELPAEAPSTAWTIAALIACGVRLVDDRRHRLRTDRRRPALLAGHRRHEPRLHELAVVRHGGRDEGHLERRHERLGLAVGGVGQLDVVGEAARLAAVAVGDLRHRGRQVERDRLRRSPSGRRTRRDRRRRSPDRSARSRCCTRPRSRRRGRGRSSRSRDDGRRGPGSRRPAARSSRPPAAACRSSRG